jgi:hypothetical protein
MGGPIGGALGLPNPAQILGSIGNAFGSLFGQKPSLPHMCHPQPLPFSPVPGFPLNNPFGVLKPAFPDISKLAPALENILNIFQGRPGVQTPSSPSTGGTSSTKSEFGNFGRIDSLMDEAKALMNKENPSQADLAKAQELMQRASLLGTALTNMMALFFQTQKSIAQNFR